MGACILDLHFASSPAHGSPVRAVICARSLAAHKPRSPPGVREGAQHGLMQT